MTDDTLARFIADCRERMSANPEPADCGLAIRPLMRRLVTGGREFLEPRHFAANPDHYARNVVYAAGDAGLSLFTLVWRPGQWTPAHDREQTVGLHLYGREMNSFHIYDV